MRDNCDFSNGIKNPYASQLKKQITVNVGADTVNYFKPGTSSDEYALSRETLEALEEARHLAHDPNARSYSSFAELLSELDDE